MKIEKVSFERNSSNSQNGESSSCETIKQQALAIKESSLTYLQDPLLTHFLIFILFCSIAIIFIIGIMGPKNSCAEMSQSFRSQKMVVLIVFSTLELV